MVKNQWFDEVAKDVSQYNLSDAEVNRIASDYELMAEATRLANKSGINYLSVGSTPIKEDGVEQYTHGSIAGDPKLIADAIAVSMFSDPRIAEIIQDAIHSYGYLVKISHRK